MISIVRFYNSAIQRLTAGTSGFFKDAVFNAAVADSQTELLENLAPFFETNQQVKDAVAPFVASFDDTTNNEGELEKQEDYAHLVAVSVDGFASYPISVNEVAITRKSRIRVPGENDLYFHYQEDDLIKFLPEQELEVKTTYLRNPDPATIILTVVSSDDDDYVTPTAGDDLEWPEMVYNLLLYMVLDKLGISMKDQMIYEYAQLGIQKERIKTQPVAQ